MANLRKRIPVRQLSLQCDRPQKTSQERKKSLTKQYSEDLTDFHPIKCTEKEVGIRISLSAKNRTKDQEPPPVKIAWSDDKKSPRDEVKDGSGILIKKCPEVRRIQSPAKTKLNPMDSKDSILYSRVGQTLKDRDTNKTNLNIILTHTTAEHKQEDILADVSNTDRSSLKPKIMLPLKPEVLYNGDGADNMKNVFQTHIRRAVRQKSVFDDSVYSPSRTEAKSTTIVVPVIDAKAASPSNLKPKIILRKNNEDDENNLDIIKRPSRPSTAASTKRELFQKRANSAFNAQITRKEAQSVVRPPLVRTASVPLKPEPAKPKFVATKRRVRTAKAKFRCEKDSDEESSVGSSCRRRGTLQRCVSAAGVLEVVTMVSLVSPSGSENEDEDLEDGEQKGQGVKVQETVVNAGKTGGKLEEQGGAGNAEVEEKSFSLRKTVKSVSFQQSSIHAVRSFSASFPGRRCSMAAGLYHTNNVPCQMQKIQEKRAPVGVLEDEGNVAKRRLVKTKSAPTEKSMEKRESGNPAAGDDKEEEESTRENLKESTTGIDGSNSDKFENPKEKQCWDMYRKMSEKGLAISYDTILRGMLTPTEYRLRRKPSVVPEDNCEITQQN